MVSWTSYNSVRGGLTVQRSGKIKVRSIWIEDPEDCIMSRDKDELHVLEMMNSIAENGLVNPNLVILMWLPEDSDEAAQYPLGSVNFDLAQDKPLAPCMLLLECTRQLQYKGYLKGIQTMKISSFWRFLLLFVLEILSIFRMPSILVPWIIHCSHCIRI